MFKKFSDSILIEEARKQSKGKIVWQEVLIFLAVFGITTLASSFILAIPMGIDLVKKLLSQGGSFAQYSEMLKAFRFSEKYILISLFATIVTTIGAIICCTKIEKRTLTTMGFVRKNAVKDYLIGFAVGIGMFAAALLLCVISGMVTVSFSGGSIGMILLFLLGYLIQGMSEEVLLRGYFMVSLARSNSIGWAVMMSSVMFALLHIFNDGISVMAIVNITLFGLMMALYMLKQGSIWGVCAIHSAWNFVQGNVFGVQVSGMPLTESLFVSELTGSKWITGGDFGLEGGLTVTIVLLAGIVVIMLRKRKSA